MKSFRYIPRSRYYPVLISMKRLARIAADVLIGRVTGGGGQNFLGAYRAEWVVALLLTARRAAGAVPEVLIVTLSICL